MIYLYGLDQFPNKSVDIGILHTQVITSTISLSILSVDLIDDVVHISFVDKLDQIDHDTLDEVVSSHQGPLPYSVQVLETVMIVPNKQEIVNKSDWQSLGGIVMHTQVFGYPLDELYGQVTGLIQTDGMEVQATIVENGTIAPTEIVSPPYTQMNTKGQWAPFIMASNVVLSPGFHSYQILAKKGNTPSAWLKHTTLSIIRKIL